MIRHISVSISTCLAMTDEKLGEIFEGDGKEIRQELLERQAAGELKIGSEGCEGFDPVKGCPGHEDKRQQIKCNCPCHTDRQFVHVVPCCENGFIKI